MSLIASSGRQSWRDFLDAENGRDMTIERAHDLARRFLIQEGFDLSAYTVDVKLEDRGRGYEGRVKVSIFPRPVLPSFGAEWDNNWNRE